MIHSELPKTTAVSTKSYRKEFTSVITPDKILANEKLVLTAMFAGMGLVLLTWALRKAK